VASVLTEEQERRATWVRHRIARPHPVTGRTALYAVSNAAFSGQVYSIGIGIYIQYGMYGERGRHISEVP
jgi:hypothetical protein